MNRSEMILERMKTLTINNPLSSPSKVLITDKPLGLNIPIKLLATGLEVNIKKAMDKVTKTINKGVSFNFGNIFSKEQIQAIVNNPNFPSFSKSFKKEVSNVTT